MKTLSFIMNPKYVDEAYLIKNDFNLGEKFDVLSGDEKYFLKKFGRSASDGDILRCFLKNGFVNTFVIHLDEPRTRPLAFRIAPIKHKAALGSEL